VGFHSFRERGSALAVARAGKITPRFWKKERDSRGLCRIRRGDVLLGRVAVPLEDYGDLVSGELLGPVLFPHHSRWRYSLGDGVGVYGPRPAKSPRDLSESPDYPLPWPAGSRRTLWIQGGWMLGSPGENPAGGFSETGVSGACGVNRLFRQHKP